MREIAVYLVLISVFLISCKEEDNCLKIHFGKDTVLLPGTGYCAEDMSFSLQFEDIIDSRCPEGVVCVWQGEATITLTLKGAANGNVILKTTQQASDTIGDYTFQLLDVIPYPKYKQPLLEDDYRIVVRIGKVQ